MNIDSIFSNSVKLTNVKWVKEKMIEYNSSTQTPTFRGLLNYLGFTTKDLKKLMDLISQSNKQAMQVYMYLEKYKNMLEAKIEELIIYNGRHPDYEGKFFDTKALQWVLERANPEIYKPTKTQEKVYELKNDSGYSLESKDGNGESI